jgi:glycosyltransferase involved in cell wall biosynthesis
MPLLSFVVTCYNLEIYINDCINSIIFQFASDVEIIIINDASTDGSFEICNQIQINNQSLVKLIHLDNLYQRLGLNK